MKFVPTYVGYLEEMFKGIIMDGQAAVIPGSSTQHKRVEEEDLGDQEGEEQEEDEFLTSTMSSRNRKRTNSTVSTGTSPSKKSKSPMVKVFQGLLVELKESRSKEEAALAEMVKQREEELTKRYQQREEELAKMHQFRQMELEKRHHLREMEKEMQKQKELEKKQKEKDDIKRCLLLVKQARGGPTSDEFAIATRLFQHEYYRDVFDMIDTNEEKLIWLRKTWSDME